MTRLDSRSSRRLAGFLLTAVSLAGCSERPASRETARPNVLLITLDTTRADRLGCYGHDVETSPNLDALARDATRFERAFSTSGITPIAHASILTGLTPARHGLRVFYGPVGHFLDASHPNLAVILQSRGWATGAFISAYPASERFGLHWGFDTFETEVAASVMQQDPGQRPPRDGFWEDDRVASAQRRADATTDQMLEWLSGAERPFLLWAHYFDPHDPSLVPPGAILERFGVTRERPDAVKAVYDPEIWYMDSQIGRLLDTLKSTGEYENTVITVLSDHGQGLGDHGWFPHRLLYQEQIRIPLIVRVPGRSPRVVEQVVSNVDVMPTLLEAVGVEAPVTIEGRSLLRSIDGDEQPARPAFAEALNTLDVHAPRQLPTSQKDLLFSVVDGDWKLIHHHDRPENSELYHLTDDPAELRNVAASHPEQRDRLLALIRESGVMEIELIDPSDPESDEHIEKLRSLGYVGR